MKTEIEKLRSVLSELKAKIAELKRSNTALLEEKRILDEILDSLPGTFYIWDERPRLIRWNKNHEIITEYPGEDYPNMLPSDFFDEKAQKTIEQAVERTFTGKELRLEATLVTKSGKRIPHLYTAVQTLINGNPVLMGFGINISERIEAERKLRDTLKQMALLEKQLTIDYTYLGEEIGQIHDHENIIGQSEVLKYVLYNLSQVAPTDTSVLILGESGTGKELIARAIHNSSERKERPLVKVDCTALPSNLIESELFGHEKGAFTGAGKTRIGRFEIANGGTIFLDEIGELPLELQQKLLRVLQDGQFERLGSSHVYCTDVRVIAATNRNLENEIKSGRFREDLWYRLSVFPLSIPPLRDRIGDIPLLVSFVMGKVQRKLGKKIEIIPTSVMKALNSYSWPGNVRELENVIERAVIVSSGNKLQLAAPLQANQVENNTHQNSPMRSLAQMEKDYILEVLDKTSWNISGKGGAAELLGLNSSTLRGRMRKYSIHRPNHSS